MMCVELCLIAIGGYLYFTWKDRKDAKKDE